MGRTEKYEQDEIDRVIREECNKEPRYPIIERPESAQLAQTIIMFAEYDSEGRYMDIE